MKKIHTHYDNLKVSRTAPAEVIRAAYKALSQKHHPDRNAGNSEAGRIMAIINVSYEILSNEKKRREHDLWIAQQELMAVEEIVEKNSQSQPAPPPPSDSVAEAMAFGLSKEEIEYLGKPIRADRYRKKYWVFESKLSKAISLGKIRGVICRGVLWVQDQKIA